jgi:hypothetical protein
MKINALVMIASVAALASGALVAKMMLAKKAGVEVELVSVAWQPPQTTIDPEYVAAAKRLLGNGLGDPRNGRFSKVQINIGDAAWGQHNITDAYGWVSADGKNVVLLDGVEYPLTGTSTPADLQAVIAGQEPHRPRIPSGIQVSTSSPALPALLLLVGKPELAEQVYRSTIQTIAASPAEILFGQMRQRFTMLSAQALMSRKDAEGLIWSKSLVKEAMIQDAFPITHPSRFGGATSMTPNSKSNLGFAKSLYADFQRRVEHPKREPVDLAALMKLEPSKRVSALVDALDTVEARQMGQPGGIDYLSDPVCKALSEQGNEAVLPLIEAIDSDQRFTRSVSYGRDFFPERSIHSVKSMAWNLLTFVWPSASGLQEQGSPIPTAMTLRKVWDTQKGQTEEERWLGILRDDHAGERQWLAAGEYLTKPADEIRHGIMSYGSANSKAPMSGEPLRAAHNAEVIKLMSDRAIQMATQKTNSGMDSFVCMDALSLAHCLAKWDLAASTECLKAVCKASLDATTSQFGGAANAERMGRNFGMAIADRAKAHDKTAAADYDKLCAAMNFEQGFMDISFLRPIWEAPTDPGMRAVGERLMDKWTKDLSSDNMRAAAAIAQPTTDLLPSTPMLQVAAYRNFLISALRNTRNFGTLEMDAGPSSHFVRYRLGNGGSGSWNLSPDEDPKSLDNGSRSFSIGDFVAQKLANGFVKGTPSFHILWPEAKRSQAKAALAAWLGDGRRDWLAVAKTSGFYRMYQ